MTCSKGTCQYPVVGCWHAGDSSRNEQNVVAFLVESYSMWGWKIVETNAPLPVAKWMKTRRKAKRKRQKERRRNDLRDSRTAA